LPVFVVVSGLPIFVVISVLPVCVDDKEVLYLDLTIKFYAVIILVMMRLAAAGTTAAGAGVEDLLPHSHISIPEFQENSLL